MTEGTKLRAETVRTRVMPMVYVTRDVTMDSDDIGRQMGEAFQALGEFMEANRIAPVGPPLAVYYDYSDTGMRMDVGFPVAPPALANAKGDIKAGTTPSGTALKFVHRGPYDKLRDVYKAIEAHFEAEGIPSSPVCWEVYVNDPDTTPESELVTEIFMKQAPTA